MDRDAGALRCLDLRHRGPARFPQFEQATRERAFAPGIGLPGRVWTTAQPAWIADVVHDSNFPRAPIAAAEGLHGAFAFPIKFSQEVLGVIEFFSPEVRQPDEAVLRMFEGVGSQIGQFLQRRRAEDSLRASAQRTRQIVETAYDAFVAMDDQGRIMEWNQQAATLFGWSAEEALGQVLADLIIPRRYREAHARGLQKFLATGKGPMIGNPIELPALHRSGREIPVELMVSAIKSDRGYFFSAFLHDVTDRKRTEDTFRFLAEASASLAALVDYESTLQSVARTWAGTCLAAAALARFEPPASAREAKRLIRQGVNHVAKSLGNTPAICRKCYIHPAVFEAFERGRLCARLAKKNLPQRRAERSVIALLKTIRGNGRQLKT